MNHRLYEYPRVSHLLFSNVKVQLETQGLMWSRDDMRNLTYKTELGNELP